MRLTAISTILLVLSFSAAQKAMPAVTSSGIRSTTNANAPRGAVRIPTQVTSTNTSNDPAAIADDAAITPLDQESTSPACEVSTQQRLQRLFADPDFSGWAEKHLGGISLTGDTVILAWDHEHDLWSIYDWKGEKKQVSLRKGKAKLADAKLQIAAPSGQSVLMFATNTNPLVYSAKASAVTTTDTAEVAQLKKLAGLLGGAITALFKVSGGVPAATTPSQIVACDPESDEIKLLLLCANEAATRIQHLSRNIEIKQSRAISFIQVVELKEEPSDDLKELFSDETEEDSTSIADIDEAFRDLNVARKAILEKMACTKVGEAAAAALKYFDEETDTTKRKAKLNALTKTIDGCTEDDESEWQKASDELLAGSPDSDERMKRLALTPEVTTRAAELLAKRQPLFKTAAWLRDLERTARLYGGADFDYCAYVDGVVAVRGGSIEAVLDKQNSGGFTISSTLPTTDFLTTRSSPVEKKVDVTSTTKWGLGAGLIYTDLEESTWKAVTDPTDSTRKVIGKPSTSSRAGQVALLANLHPDWATVGSVAYGLQFGAGTDTAKPSLFFGVSVDLGRWFRVGAGRTWQRVKALSAGQTELKTVIADDDAIQTRDAFRSDFYISLSISLDGIPLFGGN